MSTVVNGSWELQQLWDSNENDDVRLGLLHGVLPRFWQWYETDHHPLDSRGIKISTEGELVDACKFYLHVADLENRYSDELRKKAFTVFCNTVLKQAASKNFSPNYRYDKVAVILGKLLPQILHFFRESTDGILNRSDWELGHARDIVKKSLGYIFKLTLSGPGDSPFNQDTVRIGLLGAMVEYWVLGEIPDFYSTYSVVPNMEMLQSISEIALRNTHCEAMWRIQENYRHRHNDPHFYTRRDRSRSDPNALSINEALARGSKPAVVYVQLSALRRHLLQLEAEMASLEAVAQEKEHKQKAAEKEWELERARQLLAEAETNG